MRCLDLSMMRSEKVCWMLFSFGGFSFRALCLVLFFAFFFSDVVRFFCSLVPHVCFLLELPDLHSFFEENGIIVASFATEWFLTLFSACIVSGGESTLLIWDTLMFRGIEFLPALGLSLLKGARADMMDNPERAVDVLKNLFKEEESGKKV
jgi:hypothetical protein